MYFPLSRLRRNRKAEWSRNLIRENNLTVSDIIQPLFIIEGHNVYQEISTMPDVKRLSIDLAVETAKKAADLGIPLIALFPSIERSLKSDDAKEAFNENNLMCRAVREIKQHVLNIGIMVDVALDPYTSHNHDGIVIDDYVDNDKTIAILTKQALSLARNGCDMVAPSDMMDGRIKSIRLALEKENFHNTQIVAYSVKFASAFYGPFRDAVGSTPLNGKYLDKRSYQIEIGNSDEAMREIAQDIEEGADLIILKPGMPYLDILKRAKDKFNIPFIAYQVSGEYSMLKVAGLNGILNYEQAMFESLIAFKRAGASAILSYAAMEVAELIK